MELKELKSKTTAELEKLLAKNREVLRDINFKVSSKQLKNIREIRQVKKLIARILTLIGQHKKAESIKPEIENNQA